ncbi:MAG: hypothetical protein GWN00_28520 [Aliifodinibius sp.]|nr:hypothetical protein [Fodinibius sp.]NIY28603.1 hypothetical protein [Fodinibius sp.]
MGKINNGHNIIFNSPLRLQHEVINITEADQSNDKEESVIARIRPWAHEIVEEVAKSRSGKLMHLGKQAKMAKGEEKENIEKKMKNIKTSYVDIMSELILIGSSNLIGSGLEYYVEGDRAELSYD